MYDDFDIEYYEKKTQESLVFINSQELVKININEINVNDKIIINYYPQSQIYIYDLYTKFGIVTEIKYEVNDDKLFFIKLKNDNDIYDASHGYLNIYSRGYNYTIYKIIDS